MEWRGVALYIGFDIQRLASQHNSDAVVTNRATQQHLVPRPYLSLSQLPGGTDDSHTSSIDEQTIRFTALDHLRVACDDGDARLCRRSSHRRNDTTQIGDREAFLQDKACREV